MFRLISASLAFLAASVSATPGVVQTDLGAVQGYTSSSVDIWRGIPFAAPPTGENRFRRPQPATPWTGVRTTVSQQHICPQVRLTDFLYLGNEDCLYLDVYSPSLRADPLPVLVWFFGGGYIFGDGWEFGFYDGENLAKERDMVIVTLNYRLGPLGFMALDELTSEDADGLSGNMALHDQRQALQWIQRNIRNFGGDPSRVTIAGESAGAFSVCWHLTAPGSAGLFSAAIMESSTCEAEEFFLTEEKSKSWSKGYSTMVGCDPDKLQSDALLKCLRNLPTGQIMGHLLGSTAQENEFDDQVLHVGDDNFTVTAKQQAWIQSMHRQASGLKADTYLPLLYPVMSWGTTIDGHDLGLPDQPLRRLRSGNYSRVPVIAGTNEDEGSIFIPIFLFVIKGLHIPFQEADLTTAFNHFFNNNASIVASIFEQYPSYSYSSPAKDAAAILRDYFFVCSSRSALSAMHDFGSPVWLYHFTYKGDWIESPILGEYHSAELPFVFSNPWPPILHIFSARDKQMANTFGTYWSNLIHYHNPNGDGTDATKPQLQWPSYNSTTLENVILDVPPSVETDFTKTRCDFWDQVNANYPW